MRWTLRKSTLKDLSSLNAGKIDAIFPAKGTLGSFLIGGLCFVSVDATVEEIQL